MIEDMIYMKKVPGSVHSISRSDLEDPEEPPPFRVDNTKLDG